MRLLLLVPLMAFSVALLATYGDDKKEEKKEDSRAEKFKALKMTFDKERTEVLKRFREADPEEQLKIRTEAKELYVLNATRALRIAAENPKDETGLDAAVFAAEQLLTFRSTGDDMDKALAIITENHLGSPKIKSLLTMMAQAGESGQKFLKTVAEKATDRSVKGVALYLLGSATAEKADETDDEKKAEALTAEAIAYLEAAVKEAGETKFGNSGTLAQAAEDELVALRTLSIGKPAPDVEGTDLTGRKIKLSSFKGKVVLLDMWATWCGPCKAMIPHARELANRLKEKPFVLVSVSADDEKKTLEEFLKKTEMPWTHFWDGPESEVLKKYRVKAFPTLILIDAKGVIRKKFIGAPEHGVLDKAVEELVSKANDK